MAAYSKIIWEQMGGLPGEINLQRYPATAQLRLPAGSDNYAHCPYMRNMPQRLSAMHFGSNLVTSNRLYPKPKTYQQKWYTVIGDIYAAND
jgi:hypothetical protein